MIHHTLIALPCAGIAPPRHIAYPQGMKLYCTVTVEAPASTAWKVLGEGFGHISEWASLINASSLDRELGVGAVRTCQIARFGPVPAGTIEERLIDFHPAGLSFGYEALSGMPRFVGRAVNRWSVTPLGANRCMITSKAILELQGPMRLMGPALKRGMLHNAAQVLAELKHRLEYGQPHPRKRQADHTQGASFPAEGSAGLP